MLIIFIYLLMSVFFTTLYTCIATLTNGLSLYFMLIWTPLGFLTSAILMALYLLFLIYVLFPILKPGSILLQKLTYPFIKFVNILRMVPGGIRKIFAQIRVNTGFSECPGLITRSLTRVV